MLGELSDISRVLFIADYNSAAVVMRGLYRTRRQIWTIVTAKYETMPDLFTPEESTRLLEEGAVQLDWAGYEAKRSKLVITAVGGYQLVEALKASERLAGRQVPHSVVYMLEPDRFRDPRSRGEQAHVVPEELRKKLYPDAVAARIFVVHTRPQTMLGVLYPLNTGYKNTVGLGYIGQGGTLTAPGMLFVNRTTWAHILDATARVLGMGRESLCYSQGTGCHRWPGKSGRSHHLTGAVPILAIISGYGRIRILHN